MVGDCFANFWVFLVSLKWKFVMWAVWIRLEDRKSLCRCYGDVAGVKWFEIVFGKELVNKVQD